MLDNISLAADAATLSPIALFMQADWIVRGVMIGLLLASILSWTLLLIKLFEFGSLNRGSDRFLEAFRGANTLAEIRRVAAAAGVYSQRPRL